MESNIKILLVVCMLVVFLMTFAGALLPLKIFGRKDSQSEAQSLRSEKIASLCNCLAGGVFLATCFLGLIPAARQKFEQVFAESNYTTDYPVCEAVVVAGFFLILLIEQAVTSIQQQKATRSVEYVRLQQMEDDGNSVESHFMNMEEEEEDDVIFASPSQTRAKTVPNSKTKSNVRSSHSHSHLPDVRIANSSSSSRGHSHSHSGHSHYGSLNSASMIHSIVLLLALSVHSVFEGMALGLQTNVKQIMYLLVAMVAHESLAAFALGTSLLKTGVRLCPYVVYSAIFAGMIPLGTAIGVWIQATPGFGADVCSAVMQALAAGIFIFVTFFEILNHEFESGDRRLLKVFVALAGYVALAALEVVG